MRRLAVIVRRRRENLKRKEQEKRVASRSKFLIFIMTLCLANANAADYSGRNPTVRQISRAVCFTIKPSADANVAGLRYDASNASVVAPPILSEPNPNLRF